MAFGSARGGAPGTYIYESAVAAQAGRASFNTTYMVVAAPADHATDAGSLTRNIEHINIYLNKTGYWTTEDLTPLQNAVAVDQGPFNAAVAAL